MDRDDQPSFAIRGALQERAVAPRVHRAAGQTGAAPNPRRVGTIALTLDITRMRCARSLLVASATFVAACTGAMVSSGSAVSASAPTTRGEYAATASRIFDLINAERRHQ